MAQSKEILAWDFDDILFPFLRTFFVTFHNVRYGSSFSFDDIFSYELEKVIGCDWHEKQRRINEFYCSRDHDAMLPAEGAIEAAVLLSSRYRNVIITARPKVYELQTRTLLELHAPPGLFEDKIHFLDHYAQKGGIKLSKGDKCAEIGAVACIEDGLHNALTIAEAGVRVYLPDMPWNQGPLPPLVKRIQSLDEAANELMRREAARQ
jgi:uncharacterized HAD superfamily protein